MTTTDMFSGMSSDAKPSSRVLQQPGGKSSNIFGTEEDSRPQRHQPQQTSILFGAEDETKEKVGKRQGGPADNSRANVFGGSMIQDNTRQDNKKRGQGDEFPVYDKAVYAANLTPQRRNKAQASTYNPITGEDTPGHLATEPPQRRGKRSQQNSTGDDQGAYNLISGAPYATQEDSTQSAKEGGDNQTEPNDPNSGKHLPVHTTSRVLNPPGGKSSGPLW